MILIEEQENTEVLNCLSSHEFRYPLEVIRQYFHKEALHSHREKVAYMIKTSIEVSPHFDYDPQYILHTLQDLEKLVEACWVLQQYFDDIDENPSIIDEAELEKPVLDKKHYIGWQSENTTWNCHPHNLADDEFINPYLALGAFFDHQDLADWKTTLHNIFEYSLAEPSLNDARPGCKINGLEVKAYCLKLVEAAYLVDVRENLLDSAKRAQ
jgi:hypothetical protein